MKHPLKFRVWEHDNESSQLVALEELLRMLPLPTSEQIDQYTGLQDRFNQEIYAEDILLCQDENGEFYHHPVEFNKRKSHSGEEALEAGYFHVPSNGEVVGNTRQARMGRN